MTQKVKVRIFTDIGGANHDDDIKKLFVRWRFFLKLALVTLVARTMTMKSANIRPSWNKSLPNLILLTWPFSILLQDNRMTYSLRSMIGLIQKMFGDQFWENTILEATHWNYHDKSVDLRESSNPPITETWWAGQFNSLLAREYGIQVSWCQWPLDSDALFSCRVSSLSFSLVKLDYFKPFFSE